MQKCENCDTENNEEARFCIECGKPLQTTIRYDGCVEQGTRDWRDRRDFCFSPFIPLNLLLLIGVLIVLAGLLEVIKAFIGPIWPSLYRLDFGALAALIIGGYLLYIVYTRVTK